jgi:hypothetical protein
MPKTFNTKANAKAYQRKLRGSPNYKSSRLEQKGKRWNVIPTKELGAPRNTKGKLTKGSRAQRLRQKKAKRKSRSRGSTAFRLFG